MWFSIRRWRLNWIAAVDFFQSSTEFAFEENPEVCLYLPQKPRSNFILLILSDYLPGFPLRRFRFRLWSGKFPVDSLRVSSPESRKGWEDEVLEVIRDVKKNPEASTKGIVLRKRLQLRMYNNLYRIMFDRRFESGDDPLFNKLKALKVWILQSIKSGLVITLSLVSLQ